MRMTTQWARIILNTWQLIAERWWIGHEKGWAKRYLPHQCRQPSQSCHLRYPSHYCKLPWTSWDEEQWQRRCLYKLLRCPLCPRKVSSPYTGHCLRSCSCNSVACARHGLGARKCISNRTCTSMDGPRNSYRLMWGITCLGPFSFEVHPSREQSRSPALSDCFRNPGRWARICKVPSWPSSSTRFQSWRADLSWLQS